MGWGERDEFRFFKTRKDIRIKFLEKIRPFKFKIRSLVVDKRFIYSKELKNNKNSFYAFFIKTALKYSRGSILNAKIRIDGSGDRVFRKNFISYLRNELNTIDAEIMKNCKMVDSQSSGLIQMADMIAGNTNRFYRKDKPDFSHYRDIIKKHIEDEWPFK